MCYYTDDNALSASGRDFHQVQKYLKQKFKILGTDCMMIMVCNPGKCEFTSFKKAIGSDVFAYHEIQL